MYPPRPPSVIALAAVLFWGLLLSASAQLTYVTNNGSITITGYTGSNASVTIPATLNGYRVTAIGAAAFGGDAGLTSVSIPNSVTNIGAFAFSECGLTDAAIPGSVIGIGVNAFASCLSLTNISVNSSNPAYSSLNGVLFDKSLNTLIQYPPGLSTTSYIVPTGARTISDYAFYGASAINSVAIPASVNSIGNEAFAYCITLTTVYFGGNAPNVGTFTFYQASFGSGVTVYCLPGTTGWAAFSTELGSTLAASIFWYLPAPQILNFEPSFGVHNAQFGFTISWATNATLVVEACSNLSNPLWLPISTNIITATNGTANFADPQWSGFRTRFYRLRTAASLFAYTTANGAITITGYTGSNPSVAIPSTINGYPVVAIGNTAFGGISSVTNVTMPNTVTNIGAFAFAASGLTAIIIPSGVVGIGQDAFASCERLANISVDSGNPAYSSLNGVLFDKARHTLIQYPSAMAINNYIVPDGVITIGDDAFYGASGFAGVTIPDSVSSIGDDAFAYCNAQNNLYLDVYFEGNAPNLGFDSFYADGSDGAIVAHRLPGTAGWNTFSAALGNSLESSIFWYWPQPMVLKSGPSFGVTSGTFGFIISWATNATVIVDACTNLANAVWLPISTNTVTATIGTATFNDAQWKTFSRRFYRLRSQ
jgi:hypothetical protein